MIISYSEYNGLDSNRKARFSCLPVILLPIAFDLSLLGVCVCVCVCVCVRVCACVRPCVCVCVYCQWTLGTRRVSLWLHMATLWRRDLAWDECWRQSKRTHSIHLRKSAYCPLQSGHTSLPVPFVALTDHMSWNIKPIWYFFIFELAWQAFDASLPVARKRLF